jgi:hypothetical protein
MVVNTEDKADTILSNLESILRQNHQPWHRQTDVSGCLAKWLMQTVNDSRFQNILSLKVKQFRF